MILNFLKTCLLTACFGLSSVNNVSSDFLDHQIINDRLDNPRYVNTVYAYTGTFEIKEGYQYNNLLEYFDNHTTSLNNLLYVTNNLELGYFRYWYNTSTNIVSFNNDIDYTLKFTLTNSEFPRGYFIYDRYNDAQLSIYTGNIYIATDYVDIYNGVSNAINLDNQINNEMNFEVFDFNFDFNYNSYANGTRSDIFVQDSYFSSASTVSRTINYSLPLFESNGQFFNRISITVFNAYATRYYDGQNYRICSSTGYSFFSVMYFTNTTAEYSVLVYNRSFGQYVDSDDDVQVYLTDSGTWVNTEYRHLKFYGDLTPSNKDNLAKFNNLGTSNGISTSGNYFGDSFALINTAFTGLVGLLAWNIFPGISLGMIIVIPFVVTLLIFIVKLFKR